MSYWCLFVSFPSLGPSTWGPKSFLPGKFIFIYSFVPLFWFSSLVISIMVLEPTKYSHLPTWTCYFSRCSGPRRRGHVWSPSLALHKVTPAPGATLISSIASITVWRPVICPCAPVVNYQSPLVEGPHEDGDFVFFMTLPAVPITGHSALYKYLLTEISPLTAVSSATTHQNHKHLPKDPCLLWTPILTSCLSSCHFAVFSSARKIL